MEKKKLEQYLNTNTARLYCVLDGASVPKLPMRLYETGTPNVCLFSGDLPADMQYVAPYLAYLGPGEKFTEWVLSEGFGKHWGIFLHTRYSMNEMRKHFRSLVNVYDENANSLIFRFYDPRVMRNFLPTCNEKELETFFGKVDSFFAESENAKGLIKYQIADKTLKQTDLN
jgi:hypothetical protein